MWKMNSSVLLILIFIRHYVPNLEERVMMNDVLCMDVV